MQLLRMIQFFMVWGTGNMSTRAQEVWSPSYICAARCFLSFSLPPLFFFILTFLLISGG